jgi:hypothetical protein
VTAKEWGERVSVWSTDQPCENVVGEVRLLIANLADQEECSVRLAGHLQRAEAELDEEEKGWLDQATRDAAEIVRLEGERDRLSMVNEHCVVGWDGEKARAEKAEAERDRLRDALGNAMVALRNATDGLGDQRSIDEGRAMVIAYCSERKAEEALAGSKEGAP